jgi:alkanesulfonate monooxygenase SsuD/methylene tetrahydromethanopterin reductase-like flavin-dependent oxidoreductase (luciferase family)
MNVGIYFDLRNPTQWAQDPARLHAFTLELCEEADHLGVHSIWVTEHHRFDDGYVTQPLTFAAAVAARTKRARVGTAVVLAPLHHPADIAEQAALVDLISGGRFELGLGAGYRAPEFELFGADANRRYGTTDAAARAVRELWSELTPAPVQDRIPIWMGYGGPQGARRAGLLGEGLLSVDPTLAAPYLDALDEAGHGRASGRMGGNVSGWVSSDPEADWPVVSKHLAYQLDSYRRYMVEGTGAPVPRPVDPERLRVADATKPLASFLLATPTEAAQKLHALGQLAPVETVFFFASIGGMDETWTLRHVQTICNELTPLLRTQP